ncbi:MAG: T9SS type A sorting domain-containing protein [Bacteroidales bacterium]|nr:T9SS type A sorting domain-containing protein [Bacteroidales bacterium]
MKKCSKLFTWLLMLALLVVSATARAQTIDISTASGSGQTYTVSTHTTITGTLLNATGSIVFNVTAPNVTLTWEATLTGSADFFGTLSSYVTLLNITGSGSSSSTLQINNGEIRTGDGGNSITIQTNGHVVVNAKGTVMTGNGGFSIGILTNDHGNVIIDSGTVRTGDGGSSIAIQAGGNVTLNDGTMRTGGGGSSIVIRTTGDNSNIIINNGEVSANSVNCTAIYATGLNNRIEIKGGYINASEGGSIAIQTVGDVFVSGGTVRGAQVSIICSGENRTVTVSGGNVIMGITAISVAENTTVNVTDSGRVQGSPRAISTINNTNIRIVVNIKGGIVHDINSVGLIGIFAGQNSEINVSGGTVNSGITTRQNCEVNVSGGTVNGTITVEQNSTVAVSDGEVNGSIIAESLAVGSITVTVSGGVVGGSGSTISAGANSEISVSGGIVSSSGSQTITIGQNSTVSVCDGIVRNTSSYGTAISASGANTTINVEGSGIVETAATSTGYYAIRTTGTSGNVVVSGGKVVAGSALSISTTGTNSTVTVSGGIVETGTGRAISATGPNNTVTVSGGLVIATDSGTAIFATTASGTNPPVAVTVSGGTVRATTGPAINTETRPIDINGGVVFAYGDDIQGRSINGDSNVILSTAFTGATATGMVIAWNPINTTYCIGSDVDLTRDPETTSTFAVWGYSTDDLVGILYENGTNTGFLEIKNVELLEWDDFPTVADFDFTNSTMYNCDTQAIEITPLNGIPHPEDWLRVHYNGTVTPPTDAGIYAILIDVLRVPENSAYCPVYGVNMGDYTIAPKPLTVVADAVNMLQGSVPTYAYLNPLPPEEVKYQFYENYDSGILTDMICAVDDNRAILEVFINGSDEEIKNLPFGSYPERVGVGFKSGATPNPNYVLDFKAGVLAVRDITDIERIVVTINGVLYEAIREADDLFTLSIIDYECNSMEAIFQVYAAYSNSEVSTVISENEAHPLYENPRSVDLDWGENDFYIRIISTIDTTLYSDYTLRITRHSRQADYLFQTHVLYDCTPKSISLPRPDGTGFFPVFYNEVLDAEPVDAGSYDIMIEIAPGCRLEVGSLTILPRPLSVTARDYLLPCNADLPASMGGWYEISGLVCGDDDNVLTEKPTVHIPGDIDRSVAGEHPEKVIVSGGKADNYVFVEHINGTLQVVCTNIVQISISSNPPGGGVVTGGGPAISGITEMTLTATPNGSYIFVNWTIDGVMVSTANPYVFVATKDAEVVANFYTSELDFETYVMVLWNNTLMLNLRKLRENGYETIGCRWFKNGIEEVDTRTIDEFSYSAGYNSDDFLETAPTHYMFQITTKDGRTIYSSQKVFAPDNAQPTDIADVQNHATELVVYPNPVQSGSMLTLAGLTKGSPIQIYDRFGSLVHKAIATDSIITLTLNLPAGMYVIHIDNRQLKILVH